MFCKVNLRMKTIADYRRLLQDRWETLSGICSADVDVWEEWQINEWVEECQTLGCRFGCDLVADESGVRTPREALPIIGKLLAWATPPPELLTVQQTAEKLGVSPRTIYDLCDAGRLKCQRIGTGRGTIRIRPTDLDAYTSDSSAGGDGLLPPHLSAVAFRSPSLMKSLRRLMCW